MPKGLESASAGPDCTASTGKSKGFLARFLHCRFHRRRRPSMQVSDIYQTRSACLGFALVTLIVRVMDSTEPHRWVGLGC